MIMEVLVMAFAVSSSLILVESVELQGKLLSGQVDPSGWPLRITEFPLEVPLKSDPRLGEINAKDPVLVSHPNDGCLTANNHTCSGHGSCVVNLHAAGEAGFKGVRRTSGSRHQPSVTMKHVICKSHQFPWCKCQPGWFNAACSVEFSNVPHKTVQRLTLQVTYLMQHDVSMFAGICSSEPRNWEI